MIETPTNGGHKVIFDKATNTWRCQGCGGLGVPRVIGQHQGRDVIEHYCPTAVVAQKNS